MPKLYFYIRDISDYIVQIKKFLEKVNYEYEFHYDLNNLLDALNKEDLSKSNSAVIMDIILEENYKNSILLIRQKVFLPIILIYKEKIDFNLIQKNFIYIDTYLSLDELATQYGINIIKSILNPDKANTKKKIFILDDSPVRKKIITSALGKYNYVLYDTTPDRNIINYLESLLPNLIIMDISPKNLKLIKSIRINSNLMKIPILGLTESNNQAEISDSLEAGINEVFITNEESIPLLEAYVYKILYNLKQNNAKRILVIDDSPSLLQGITFSLRNQGFTVDGALNVFNALEIMSQNLPDVIILDISLPTMNGFQFARFLKNDPYFKDIPIIALTGINVSKAESFYAMHIGIDKYILKPYNKSIIIKEILSLNIPHKKSKPKKKYSIEYLLQKVNEMLDYDNFKKLIHQSLMESLKKLDDFNLFWKSYFDLLGKILNLELAYVKIDDEIYFCSNIESSIHTKKFLKENFIIHESKIYEFHSKLYNQEFQNNVPFFKKKYNIEFLNHFEFGLFGNKKNHFGYIDKVVLEILDSFIIDVLKSAILFFKLKEKIEKEDMLLTSIIQQIKNPLNIIDNFISLYCDKYNLNAKDEIAEHLSKALTELKLMSNELSELILLKTYTNPIKSKTDLTKILNLVALNYTQHIKQKNIQLNIDFKDNDIYILADKDLLIRMFNLVLDNAYKYTPNNGKIEIIAYKEKNYSIIEIKDTGIGIPYYTKKNIFNEFFRADEAKKLNIPGAGLGLSIVKVIAQMHNIQIFVEDNSPKGTIFKFYIPE